MKHIILTVVIAAITGVVGYFLGSGQINLGKEMVAEIEGQTGEPEKRFASEVLVQINPYGHADVPLNQILRTKQSLQTQFQIIKSKDTLDRAIKDYDLEKLLGENQQELIKVIAESIEVGQEKGTDLVKLKVHADSELEAQQIAYAVTHTYATRRTEALDKRRLEAINVFKEKRRIQEEKVEDYRTRLYSLSKRFKIPYHGKNARQHSGRDANLSESGRANQAYEDAKHGGHGGRDSESFVNSLNNLSDEDFMVTLIASGRPESAVIKTDYDQLSNLRQSKTVALSTGLEPNDKTITSLNVSIKEIEERLAKSVAKVRKKLAEDLVIYNQNVEKLRSETMKEKGDHIVTAEEKTKFGKVREDYERELAILDAIKQAEYTERISENLERDPIIIHQRGWTDETLKSMGISH